MIKKKVQLEITVDNEEANVAIEQTTEDIKEIGTSSEESLAQADALTGGLITNFKAVGTTVIGAVKALRTLKAALIATGIGALAVGIAAVTTAFTNSEEGQNKYAKFWSQLSVVTGNVFDILENIGKSILNVGKAMLSFVKGDWAGVSEAWNGLKENISDTVDGVVNFGEETRKEIKTAGELADARAKADKIERQLLVDRARADRERADLLEKAVDKTQFELEERIGFLQAASDLEEEITNKEIQLAKIRLETKKTENSLSASTKEDLEEEAQLEADLIALETARLTKQKEVTGQIIALRAEEKAKLDADKLKADADAKAEQDARIAFDLAEREALAVSEEEKTALMIEKETERYQALIDLKAKYGEDTTELEQALAEKVAEIKKASEQQEVEDLKTAEQMKLDVAMQFAALGIGLATEGSNAAKALGIANAIISTYAGAAQVLDDKTLPLYAKIAGVATVLATGFQMVRAVRQTEIPVLSVGGVTAGGGGAVAAPSLQAPSFNVVGASPINQLSEALAGQQSEPVRAYVVSNDVTTAQSVDRNIVETAGI